MTRRGALHRQGAPFPVPARDESESLRFPAPGAATIVAAAEWLKSSLGSSQEHDEFAKAVLVLKREYRHNRQSFAASWRTAWHDQIKALVRSLSNRCVKQIEGKRVIIFQTNDTIEMLDNLHFDEGSERIILCDLIQCLQTCAYRAAIVMGWNLAFEHVRREIFRDVGKLGQFNLVLVTKRRSQSQNHSPVVVYDDFFELSERFVVDIAYEARLFSKQQHQLLLSSLTDRNHFAHPNSRVATSAFCLGYVESLVVNVLQNQ
jgi:hypothetical protein